MTTKTPTQSAVSTSPAAPAAAGEVATTAIHYSPEVAFPKTLATVSGGSIVVRILEAEGGVRSVVIRPGLNLGIPVDDWRIAQGTLAVQDAMAAGAIEELEVATQSAYVEGKRVEEVRLRECSQPVSLRLIALERNIDRLASWGDEDPRPAVQQAARRRVMQLSRGEA